MDEPTHFEESRFWDLVTDWLITGPEAAPRHNMPQANEQGHEQPGQLDPGPAGP